MNILRLSYDTKIIDLKNMIARDLLYDKFFKSVLLISLVMTSTAWKITALSLKYLYHHLLNGLYVDLSVVHVDLSDQFVDL